MTIENQNQINASSIKIENWQIKKRLQEEENQRMTDQDFYRETNTPKNMIENLQSKIGRARDGLYKFIEAL